MADQVNRLVSLDTFAGIRDHFYSIVAVLDVAAVSEERHHYDLIQYRLRQRVGLAGRDAGVPQAGCLRSMEDKDANLHCIAELDRPGSRKY